MRLRTLNRGGVRRFEEATKHIAKIVVTVTGHEK